MEAVTDYQIVQTWATTHKKGKGDSHVIPLPAVSQENVTARSATFLPNLN